MNLPQYDSPTHSHKGTLVVQFRDTVASHIDRLTSDDLTKPNLYLVTTHFNDPRYNSVEKNLDYVSRSTQLVYNHLLNKIVKSHLRKQNKKYHPFMMTFLDFSGSRHHHSSFGTIPHIHSILVVHPKTEARYLDLVEQDFRINEGNKNTISIQTMDSRLIGPTEEDLETVIDYSSKSYFLDFTPYVSKEAQANMMILNG